MAATLATAQVTFELLLNSTLRVPPLSEMTLLRNVSPLPVPPKVSRPEPMMALLMLCCEPELVLRRMEPAPI